jgi:tryptophan synthase alpha chain
MSHQELNKELNNRNNSSNRNSSNRIVQQFSRLREQGRKALIPYITAGDPNPQVTVPLMHAMVDAGADIIELGVPFSDPMADGPVIQRASERALRYDVSLRQVLEMVQAFRTKNTHTPVVLMGYLNPIEVMGYAEFAEQAASHGVDGVLTVDLPPEEAGDFLPALEKQNLAPIFLIAPTTSSRRIEKIARVARGFVYYVSLKGVTGAANIDVDAVTGKINAVRESVDLPIGVGFGIKDADSAARLARAADAIVVGSALVKKVEEFNEDAQQITAAISGLLSQMRQAMDAGG